MLSPRSNVPSEHLAEDDRGNVPASHIEAQMRSALPEGQIVLPDDPQEHLTPVMTRLGAADLAAVDTLIAAGIAGSRAEILRWAIGRIRAHPAYAQVRDRVHEISDLKAQF